MKERVIPAPLDLFASSLIPAAAVLYACGAFFGLGAVGALFLPGALSVLTEDLISGGITDPSSIRTWTVIHVGLILAGFLCALGMTVGLILERRRKGEGLDLLYNLARCLVWAVRISGVCTLALMIFRLVRYLLACPWADAGIYYAYVMLVPEAVMIAQAVWLFFLLLRFLEDISGAAVSMAYTRVCERLDSRTISGFCATGFWILTALNTYLAADRMFTVTIVQAFEGDYYSVLLASHPVLVLAAVMFACGAVANLLIGLYLKRYKRTTGRLMFRPLGETFKN